MTTPAIRTVSVTDPQAIPSAAQPDGSQVKVAGRRSLRTQRSNVIAITHASRMRAKARAYAPPLGESSLGLG